MLSLARHRYWLFAAGGCAGALVLATVVYAAIITLTLEDMHLRGTQAGMVGPDIIYTEENCMDCHSSVDGTPSIHSQWAGSLMGNAGRDPLFFAQMATANQDVENVGYFCLRCHVPMTFVTNHAMPADGSAMNDLDKEGVNCHFCHAMVDPVYKPGVSPPEDLAILAGLPGGPPEYYANAQFVLDPSGTRRGPRQDTFAMHDVIPSEFHKTGEFCMTCHEVGNVAVSRQPDGTYRYNTLNERTPDENPHEQFPLERTGSEWKLSAFANGGVNMGGRFGGTGGPVVSTCQDCHMPKREAQACFFGPVRPDVAGHEFAGASAQVLDLIMAYIGDEEPQTTEALQAGRAAAVGMLEKAATLQLSMIDSDLNVRVINESGHKLPTGHIEGRRVWINVKFRNAQGDLIAEHGHYDLEEAELDEASTTVYEMHLGLSVYASQVTGLPAGPTIKMSLADTIMKDNRIPPRGFNNAAFAAAGAPVVGHAYADGQYWDDRPFAVPPGAHLAEVALYYQQTPRHYIEALRDQNTTDHWGNTLHSLWTATGKGAPILMASATLDVQTCVADFDANGIVGVADIFAFLAAWFSGSPAADIDGVGGVAVPDIFAFLHTWFAGCV
jgi:hypothetical protein